MSVWDLLFARGTSAAATAPPASATRAVDDDRPRAALLPQPGRTVIEESIATKVLHGWMQNRHQTLFPLAVNLRVLNELQRATLAQLIAIMVLANRSQAADNRKVQVRAWLASAGAEDGMMTAFDDALSNPPALNRTIDAVLAHNLGAYGYVGSLIALDTDDGAGAHLLNYLAVRLALPTTLTRSADRRYRTRSTIPSLPH